MIFRVHLPQRETNYKPPTLPHSFNQPLPSPFHIFVLTELSSSVLLIKLLLRDRKRDRNCNKIEMCEDKVGC